jgi:alkanesulfonate monooxygenase SsuD/methylene tetrahydromethanopterin reductase-like flavin-dependent oxidoreductase (luciferase family)
MLFHNSVILARRFATLGVFCQKEELYVDLVLVGQKTSIGLQTSHLKTKRADECIQILKKIWTEDVVEFKGQY